MSDEEIELLIDKMKTVSLSNVIKIFEDEITKASKRKEELLNKTPETTLENLDFEDLVKYAKYYMEHLSELLFSEEDKMKSAAMFGLLFDELPSYQDLVNGTPKLSPLVGLK